MAASSLRRARTRTSAWDTSSLPPLPASLNPSISREPLLALVDSLHLVSTAMGGQVKISECKGHATGVSGALRLPFKATVDPRGSADPLAAGGADPP